MEDLAVPTGLSSHGDGHYRRHKNPFCPPLKEVNRDIKTIRQFYQRQFDNVGSGSGLAGLFIGKGRAASMNTSEKRYLRDNRDREIQPYQQIKMTIDGLLTEFDKEKLEVERFISEQKWPKEQAKASHFGRALALLLATDSF